MNISFVTSNMAEGGAQRVISVLSKYFSENNHCVRIILTEKPEPVAYSLSERVKVVFLEQWAEQNYNESFGIRVTGKVKRIVTSNQEAIRLKQYYLRKTRILLEYFNHNPTEVLFSFLVEPNIIVGLGARKIQARIVMAERNYPKKPMLTDNLTKLRDYCYCFADVCVFQTVEQMKMFPQRVQKKAEIIPNPVKDDLPKPYHGTRKKIIVNYCGLRGQKNLELLIDAFSIVSKLHPEYNLEIFGEGSRREVLENKISELKLQNSVRIQPFNTEIHEKVKDYAMFVMTSDYEGMPNSLIEAMAIGLPVISTDCLGGGARALIDNGVNGLLVPCGDIQAVSGAMLDLIEHPDKAARLGNNAKRIRDTLAVDTIAGQWLNLTKS